MPRMDARDELRYYNDAKTIRSTREQEFRQCSAYCLPEHYSAWQTEGPILLNNGAQVTRRTVFDNTGTRSLPKYTSVLQRLLTPDGVRYQGLKASNPELNKIRRVKLYFDSLTNELFKMRGSPVSRFTIATAEVYASLGAYGTGPIYVGQRKPNATYRQRTTIYKGCMLRDIFILVNDDDEIVAVYRRFYLNVRQFKAKWPEVPLPKSMDTPQPNESAYHEFVHVVKARDIKDHDPEALDSRRHPISGSYICVKDAEYIGEEHGFRSMPYLTPRTFTVSGDPYGFSPASRVLAAMGGASATKKTYIKQGQKAVDPVLLGFDDGVLNGEVDLRPGAYNPGGLDSQGRELVKAMQTGNFQVAEQLLEHDRNDIEDSFFVTLFQILNETPEMTATEVIERVAEKTALLAPTMGRGQSEFLGPCTQREIDLMVEIGIAPQMPPELIEAAGEYAIQYTSPMAKGIHAEETAGFNRTVELAIGVAQATGDPEALDYFNWDVAIPEIADNQAVPARWMNDEAAIEAIRKNRAEQMQQQQLLQNAGGIAQMTKAANDVAQTNGSLGGRARRL